MILVDTSAWIHFLNVGGLDFKKLQLVTTCPPVIQEVLQGIQDTKFYQTTKDGLLALPLLSDPMPLDIWVDAAGIFRSGRRRGVTIRSSVDCLIAAIAIRHRVPVLHFDRDFDAIATFSDLAVVKSI